MFFETNDFAVSGVAAFSLSWDKSVGDSGVRPFHSLSFRKVGSAEFTSEGGTVRVESGDIIFVPAFCNYHLTARSEKLFVIHFNTDLPISAGIKKLSVRNPVIYHKLFEDIVNVYTKKEAGFEHECKSLLYKIMTNIERDSASQELSVYDREIQKAVDYIRENFFDRSISVHKLAVMFSMSETYFRKRFAKTVGCSPLTYINELRTGLALELLKTKYYTVSEVSDKCGFSTPYYFSNFIKSKTGRSPIDFIKNDIG